MRRTVCWQTNTSASSAGLLRPIGRGLVIRHQLARRAQWIAFEVVGLAGNHARSVGMLIQLAAQIALLIVVLSFTVDQLFNLNLGSGGRTGLRSAPEALHSPDTVTNEPVGRCSSS